ncbi:MAG: hypothetical protein DRJ51_08430 [Thermoprotei archaeon]|nr:MAG: hypothetical protein DRJ51_08430 [Thermoprotei archaeon]
MNMVRSRYIITIKFDPKEKLLSGSEQVHVLNTSRKTLDDLTVCYRLPFPHGKERLSVELNGEKLSLICMKETRLAYEKFFLIRLPTELPSGKELCLIFRFSGRMPSPRRDLIYLRDSWYPKLIFSKPSVSSYEVRALVPEQYCLASSGAEINVKNSENGLKEYSLKADKVWKFGMVLGKELRYIEDKVNGVTIRSYYIPETEKWCRVLLDNACDAIAFYCEEFGFYPHEILNIIPGFKEYTGGFPLATNVIAIHDLDKLGEKALEYSKWIIAHEIGHMYWGHYVLSSEALDWLMIGLGIYMDRQYSEARGLSLKRYKRDEKWSFIERYLEGLRKGYDTTIMQPLEKLVRTGFDWNNIIIHGKGYAIISMLELLLGKETFRRIHDEGLRRYAYKDMRSEDFKKLCEEVSGEDLDWFFYQWLYTNRFLSYKISQEEKAMVNGLYRVRVAVKRIGSAVMPIPVAIILRNGERIIKWTDKRLRIDTLTFESKLPIERVELDPDKVLPLLRPEEIPEQLVADEIYKSFAEGNYSAAADLYEIAVKRDLRDANVWFSLGLSLYDVKRYEEAIDSFKKVLEILGETSENPWVAWSYIWIGHILDILRKRKEAIRMYQKAIDTGNKTKVQFAQYSIGPIDAVTWASERVREPFIRKERILPS